MIAVTSMSDQLKALWMMLFYTQLANFALSIMCLSTVYCPKVEKTFSVLRLVGLALVAETCKLLAVEFRQIENGQAAVNVVQMIGVGALFLTFLEFVRIFTLLLFFCYNCHVQVHENSLSDGGAETHLAENDQMVTGNNLLASLSADQAANHRKRFYEEPELSMDLISGGADIEMAQRP